jgi:hypothetical protein
MWPPCADAASTVNIRETWRPGVLSRHLKLGGNQKGKCVKPMTIVREPETQGRPMDTTVPNLPAPHLPASLPCFIRMSYSVFKIAFPEYLGVREKHRDKNKNTLVFPSGYINIFIFSIEMWTYKH